MPSILIDAKVVAVTPDGVVRISRSHEEMCRRFIAGTKNKYYLLDFSGPVPEIFPVTHQVQESTFPVTMNRCVVDGNIIAELLTVAFSEPPVGGDPDFANVSFLSGFNEIDEATSFTDEADTRTITVAGNAQADTAQKKFGTSSVLFDGTGDFLSIPDNVVFDADQVLTMECFIRLSAVGVQQAIMSKRVNGTPQLGWLFYVNTGNKLGFFGGDTSPTTAISLVGTVTTLLINTWYHVAAVRESDGTWTIYVDGVIEATGSEAVNIGDDSAAFMIGRDGAADPNDFAGWIDEVRITSGVARYTGVFTPPISEFSRN